MKMAKYISDACFVPNKVVGSFHVSDSNKGFETEKHFISYTL